MIKLIWLILTIKKEAHDARSFSKNKFYFGTLSCSKPILFQYVCLNTCNTISWVRKKSKCWFCLVQTNLKTEMYFFKKQDIIALMLLLHFHISRCMCTYIRRSREMSATRLICLCTDWRLKYYFQYCYVRKIFPT